ncbi:repeat protein [Musa troglodytarum]|uniref:Repeat protein n=1 Tax=Musa troglodytarum TaxID=320322 RepID=A0A9E7G2W2_9LILI|nr:repeat protein [Musa troglodytarum]
MDSLIVSAPVHGGGARLSPLPPYLTRSSFSPKVLRLAKTGVPVAKASSSGSNPPAPLSGPVRAAASGALLLATAAAALVSASIRPPIARADPTAFPVAEGESDPSVLSRFLDSSSDGVDALRSLLYQKLEAGDDTEALAILRRLIAAQPAETEWKFLAARLLNEMGEASESRRLYEEILAVDPLSFEALFDNAVLMDRCGEGDAVIQRLEQALELAKAEQKEKAARDVRLIMAQIQFLQKHVDEALSSYEDLAQEDPEDYRPYFCQGVIYSLLGQNKQAREKFSKYHELSPRKFEVNAYLQTPLSRMKLFSTGDS